jgi:hypothetical protein
MKTVINFLQKKKKTQQDATVYQNFIPYLNEAQHVSGNTPPIIGSLKLRKQPLVLQRWKVFRTCSCWTLSGSVLLHLVGFLL